MQVTSIKSDWPKGYSRLGAAYLGLKQHAEAEKAYEEGEALPNPAPGQPLTALHSADHAACAAQG